MTATPASPNLTINNPAGVFYVKGSAAEDESWRLTVVAHPGLLAVEHKEPLTEIDITLDDSKKIAIEGGPYTDEDSYYASVLTDTRSQPVAADGLSGDMTGRVIDWNGFTWRNHDDVWVEKVRFEESLFSDRGIFQRMNVIDSDPDDPSKYPPIPVSCTTVFARNSFSSGLGAEMLSVTSIQAFGLIPAVLHGPVVSGLNIDSLSGVRASGLPLGVPHTDVHLAKTYAVGDIVTVAGVTYVCNTAGAQTNDFPLEASKWDPVFYLTNFDVISTGLDGTVTTDRDGNIVFGRS